MILGVSFDPPAANQAFREKQGFPFALLCDVDKRLGIAYGAAADAKAGYPNRISVMVDGAGMVARVYAKVDPRGHPQQVLDDLQA